MSSGGEDVTGSTRSLLPGGQGDTNPLPRTQSVTVLNHNNNNKHNVQVPENRLQLMSLTSHQTRIRDSMEKITVPTWYSNRSGTDSGDGSATAAAGRRTPGGWRRHVVGSSRTNTPETPQTRSRWSSRTLPLSYRTSSHTSLATPSSTSTTTTPTTTKQPYLGWRSQERLDIGPAYLASPSQRLASTAHPLPASTPTRSATLPPHARLALSNNIKAVADQIQDYCSQEPATTRETTPSSTTPSSATPSSAPSSPSPPPTQPLEAWSDAATPLHQNGRAHLILA